MKKFLAIVLAMLMIMSFTSLVACGDKKTETDKKEPVDNNVVNENEEETIDLENSKPNEYVFEKLEAGWEVEVGFFSLTAGYFVQEQLMGGGAKYLEDNYGFKCTLFAAESAQITSQIAQLENAITSGAYSGLIIQTSDPASIQDCVETAQERGISCVIYGIIPEYDSIVATVDCVKTGFGMGTMASKWCDVRFPDAGEGEIKVAVLGSTAIVPAKQQTEGILQSVEADPRFNLVYYSEDQGLQVDTGFTGAENAMMTDPEVRVFLVFQMAAALGVNNYLEGSEYEISEFGIFTGSYDDTTPGMIEAAENGTGAFRGTIVTADGIQTYTTMCEALVGAFKGEYKLGDIINDPMECMTTNEYVCDYTVG